MLLSNTDSLSIIAFSVPVQVHHHNAVQFVISLDNPYTAVLDGYEHNEITGFIAGANVPHSCHSVDSTVLVVSVDANSLRGNRLTNSLRGRSYVLLSAVFHTSLLNAFVDSYWYSQRQGQATFDPDTLINALTESSALLPSTDPRIERAVKYVENQIAGRLQVSDIADSVGLSERRLRHLFFKHVGSNVSSYILWYRMKLALKSLIIDHMNLGEAAHDAGFADHPHFTRTFRKMFGVTPSHLLEHCHVIRVFQ